MAYVPTAERRLQLVGAATRVIREHGLSKATARRIAEEAGVPVAGVYYHFPRGKDELYETVMDDIGVDGRAQIASVVIPGMGVGPAADAIFRKAMRWSNDTFDDQLTEYEVFIWAVRTGEYASIPKRTYREWIKHVARLLKTAHARDEPQYDFSTLARVLVAQIDGFIIQHQMLQNRQATALTEAGAAAIAAAIAGGSFTRSSTP